MKRSPWQQVQAAARESVKARSCKVLESGCFAPAEAASSRAQTRGRLPPGTDMTRTLGDYQVVPGARRMLDGTYGDCVTIVRTMKNGRRREQRFETLRYFKFEMEACWSALIIGRALIRGVIPGLKI